LVDFSNSIQFVLNSGNRYEKTLLSCLMASQGECPAAYQDLLELQQADGGWVPFWAANHSALDATCYRLSQCYASGIPPDHPPAQKALSFLSQHQNPDGSWQEDASWGDQLPPWLTPGDLASRLYLTSNCGYCMALFGAHESRYSRAADLVHSHLQEPGRLPASLQAHWLAAGLWLLTGKYSSAQDTLSYLATQLDNLDASELAWMVTALRTAGLESDQTPIPGGIDRLVMYYHPGGGWTSPDGSGLDTSLTLEVLRALILCGRLE
jgi:hypothetical protein